MKALWYTLIELPVLKVSVVLSLAAVCLVGAVSVIVASTKVTAVAVSFILGANVFLVLGGLAQVSRWHKRAREK